MRTAPYAKCSRAITKSEVSRRWERAKGEVKIEEGSDVCQLSPGPNCNLSITSADIFRISLRTHASGELREELTCEVAGIGWVDHIPAAKIIVEDTTAGGFVDVGQREIHMIAFDRAGHATDKNHRAIRFLPFDDPDVCQRVVHFAITVVVPCIVEEDEIAWVGSRPLVECTLLAYVSMDETDAIGMRVRGATGIEIDAVFEEYCAGHSGTIIGNAAAVHFNGAGSDELGCRADDSGSMRCPF